MTVIIFLSIIAVIMFAIVVYNLFNFIAALRGREFNYKRIFNKLDKFFKHKKFGF